MLDRKSKNFWRLFETEFQTVKEKKNTCCAKKLQGQTKKKSPTTSPIIFWFRYPSSMCSQSVYCKLWNIFILEIGTFRWQSFVVIHLFYIILKRHLKNYRILLQLRDRPLFPKDLFNDFEEVRPFFKSYLKVV